VVSTAEYYLSDWSDTAVSVMPAVLRSATVIPVIFFFLDIA
jgi:hypothetical protein